MLTIRPITLRAANAFIETHHRHHKKARGCAFCLSVVNEAGEVRGVAIVGRPVARAAQDGATAEVTRLCTPGEPNACSKLYAAARRACKAIGYAKIQTYTLASEPGTSLKAAGWELVATVRGRSWTCPSRPREDKHPTEDKLRWEARCA